MSLPLSLEDAILVSNSALEWVAAARRETLAARNGQDVRHAEAVCRAAQQRFLNLIHRGISAPTEFPLEDMARP